MSEKLRLSRLLPTPLLVLCLAALYHTLTSILDSSTLLETSRGSRPTSTTVLGLGGARAARDDTYIDPVVDEWDYLEGDGDYDKNDGDFDSLRPDNTNKPNANGGKDDGKNDGKNDGKATTSDDKKPNATKNKKTNDDLVMYDSSLTTNTADTTLTMDTSTAGGVDVPGEIPAVVIENGVALVPAAENATLVVSVPEVMPPMPVDAGSTPGTASSGSASSGSAIIPTETLPAASGAVGFGAGVGVRGLSLATALLACGWHALF